ncbi:hypothetical protein [Nostoc sp. DSM 114159]
MKITERIGDVEGKANIPTHFFPRLKKKLLDLPRKILEFSCQLRDNVLWPTFSWDVANPS